MRRNKMEDPILIVEGLKTHFPTRHGTVKAVDDVDFKVYKGETFGLIGESGCGKSMTALSIMRLIPPPGNIIDGKIVFKGENLLENSEEEMRSIRGEELSMIFQDPMTSLNPVFNIGYQVDEPLIFHKTMAKKSIIDRTLEMLGKVGIPSASSRRGNYPHQFSGGMRQRAMIAMALNCDPDLLIADEPTTALDVTIQAQILELIKELKEELGLSVLLITHNMGVIAEMCDRVAVMYAGKIVEVAETEELFEKPLHPYTRGLMMCLPKVDMWQDRLYSINGTVPNLVDTPDGCYFYNRCKRANSQCLTEKPLLCEEENNHYVACFTQKKK
jgi:oligopeptide/dipeptide ABC transporter ATP-binding protein